LKPRLKIHFLVKRKGFFLMWKARFQICGFDIAYRSEGIKAFFLFDISLEQPFASSPDFLRTTPKPIASSTR
jgi:hypothetical protein